MCGLSPLAFSHGTFAVVHVDAIRKNRSYTRLDSQIATFRANEKIARFGKFHILPAGNSWKIQDLAGKTWKIQDLAARFEKFQILSARFGEFKTLPARFGNSRSCRQDLENSRSCNSHEFLITRNP